MSIATTVVTASNLCDASGNKIASARISWQPVSSVTGLPMSFRYGGGGQASSQAVTAVVTNGAFTITVADTSQTYPVNIGYKVTVVDPLSGHTLLSQGYGCVQPTGGIFDFDQYNPSVPVQGTVGSGTGGGGGGGGALFSQALTFGGPGTQTVTHGLNSTSLIVQGVITSGRPTRWWATVLDANSVSVSSLGAMVLDVIVMGGSSSSSSSSGTPSTPTAPVITTQPSSVSVGSGATVTFTAAASGYPTPSVQWYTDGGSAGASWTAIAGATSPTYSFTGQTGQNGYRYRATFTNTAGTATTSAATATIGTVLASPAASWAMTEGSGSTFVDSIGGNNITIHTPNWGNWTPFPNNTQLFSETNWAQTPTTPACMVAGSPWSIEGWMGFGAFPVPHQATFISNYNGTAGIGFEIAAPANSPNMIITLSGDQGNLIYLTASNVWAAHTRHFIAVVYDGSRRASGVGVFVDGVQVSLAVGVDTLAANEGITAVNPFTISGNSMSTSLNDVTNSFECEVDHLTVYPYLRSTAQIQARYGTGV